MTNKTAMRISVENKDSSKTAVEVPEGSSALDLAKQLNLTGPDQALGVRINDTNYDLDAPLSEGDSVHFWSFDEPEGKEVFWHTTAHVLAQAVLRLWPDAKPTIGPPIAEGFYYDFADLTISEEDLVRIEKEMQSIVKENYKSQREVLPGKKEALEAFAGNKYKCELIESFEDQQLTAYRQGEFYDLCRGPHIPNLGKIKALKVLKTSGAYWRGDAKKEMLTRIYGTSFPDRKLLKEYLHLREEAKKRDHKILGPKLGLFALKDEAPGMPFILPNGLVVWNKLIDFLRLCQNEAGYVEIKTPLILTRELWEVSGHWENYRDNMFSTSVEEREYAIKPMNCPGCMLVYKSGIHSYRELPLRIAEIGHVHRYEPSGAISGLFRVRSFHQDDAHIFMAPDQIEDEILNTLELVDQIYSAFGLEYHLELSTRPEEGTIGSDEDWDNATKGLQQALERSGKPFTINEGDGAFYGPKIDFHIRDALGRTWQCGTIQLDMALPERFDLEYVDSEGGRPRPVMIHRAIYGSIERFFGILIEHFAGRFPLWLSPIQVRVLPIADRHNDFAEGLRKQFRAAGLRCDVDISHESVSKKVRNAQLQQINYMLIIGDKEVEHKTAALRSRDNVNHGEVEIASFIETLTEEDHSRALLSPFAS